MFSALFPHMVAEVCYLREALYWVALQRLPEAYYLETGGDAREYDKHAYDATPPIDGYDIVSRDECLLAGLPVNPDWEAQQAFKRHEFPAELKKWIARTSDEGRRKQFKIYLEESVAYHKAVSDWGVTFGAFLDLHAAKLFVALREARIIATGKRLPTKTVAQYLKGENGGQSLYSLDWEPIDKNFWIQKGIDWVFSRADGKDSSFALILVETAKLFEVFPKPSPQITRRVEQIGRGYLLLDEEGNALNSPAATVGRPSLPWDDFHVEMARRFCVGNIPAKQEAMIAEMREWCRTQWGRPPARSTLLSKIKPYYDALVRKSES